MKRHISRIFILSLVACTLGAVALPSCSGKKDEGQAAPVKTTKRERNFMKEGNKLYEKQRYAEAEVSYQKALGENPENGRAQFNLASTYLKQRGEDLTNKEDSLIQQAAKMLAQTSQATDVELAQASFYDRGNIAYKGEDYAAAIEMYKGALRRNPEDNQARENLRLAQLKKQQQDQNKDQKQDQNKDQNQDQNQDQQQQQQQQQNQDQNKDQNKDQNQDQQQQQQQNKDQQQQQQQQGGLSQQNAAQILKAMDDKESATRMKVENMKKGDEKNASRRQPLKPW